MTAPIAPTPLPGDVSSEALLRTLLEVSLTGFILFRPVYDAAGDTLADFTYEYLNPAAQQMLRLPERPIESFLTRYPMAGPTGIFAFYREAYVSGQPRRQEFNYQHDQLDGYFHLAAQRQGPLLVVSFTDTNDQPRSAVEEALRESQAREQAALAEAERQRGELERVFEQAPVAIAVYRGPTYTIELANPTVARLWGRTREQLLGKGLFEALPEVAGMGYEQLLDEVMATGVPYVAHAMEAQHERNGQRETVYWDFVYVPMYAAEGPINGAMVVATEVTTQVLARRQVEQLNAELEARVQERTQQLVQQSNLLRQQQQQLQSMFEQAPVALFVVRGAEFVFDVVNASMGQMLGMAPDYILGQRYFDLLPDLTAQGYRQLLDTVWHSGQQYVAQEQAARLPHHGAGETGYYNFVYVPLREANGTVSSIMCVAVDVTTQVQARQQVQGLNEELAVLNEELTATNEELHESNTQLTRTNVDLDTFVYTASHDLKAPITNIEGLLLALRDTLPPAVQAEEMTSQLLRMLEGATERFRLTIDQLTDVSRLQHAQDQPAEYVRLASVVEDVRLDLQPLLASTHAQLTVDVSPDMYVHFAPKNLRSVVYNLLSNALKYHQLGQPAVVRLHAAWLGRTIVFTVTDQGLGMNAQQQERLFGLFQRLHTHVEGTGVGLYMVKRIVENAGGTIAVYSEPNVGTTFTVVFPTDRPR